MRNNIYAIYLGCAGILIGGVGWAFDRSTDAHQPREEALFVEAGLTPVPATTGPRAWQDPQWSPAQGGVAFHDEMVALLTMAATAARAPDHTASQQQNARSREAFREPATDQRQRGRTSRRRQPPDTTIGVGNTGADDIRDMTTRDTTRRDTRRSRSGIELIGRNGRRYRIERGDRADGDESPAPYIRRYRPEREAPVEGPAVNSDPFGLFGR